MRINLYARGIGAVRNSSTGITGLEIVENVGEKLKLVYKGIISRARGLPDEAAYKHCVLDYARKRMFILEQTSDREKIAEALQVDIPETALQEAMDEYHLIEQVASDKPWVPLCEKVPEGQWG